MSLETEIDWKQRAKEVFGAPKPEHFTNYRHCCECFEHDEVLRRSEVESIGLKELGSPAWDPICFSSPEGVKYYLPAMVRLTLDNIENPQQNYLDQFLFHLILDGKNNRLVEACNREQRTFIADFLEFLIENHSAAIDDAMAGWDILRAHEIWRIL